MLLLLAFQNHKQIHPIAFVHVNMLIYRISRQVASNLVESDCNCMLNYNACLTCDIFLKKSFNMPLHLAIE